MFRKKNLRKNVQLEKYFRSKKVKLAIIVFLLFFVLASSSMASLMLIRYAESSHIPYHELLACLAWLWATVLLMIAYLIIQERRIVTILALAQKRLKEKDNQIIWEKQWSANIQAVTTRQLEEKEQLIWQEKQTRQKYERQLQTLKQSYKNLKSAEMMSPKFMDLVGHELSNILTTTKNITSNILAGSGSPVNERMQSYLSLVDKNVNRLTLFISNLINVSRIESGKLRLHKTVLPAVCSIQMAVAAMKRQFESEGLTLVQDITPMPSIYADHDKVSEILVNLLSNTAKYTPGGEKIAVSTALVRLQNTRSFYKTTPVIDPEAADHIKFSVTSAGALFPKNLLQVFSHTPGADADAQESNASELGLSVCKYFSEIHGGRIWAEGEKGKENTLSFVMPLRKAPAILLVDDDKNIVDIAGGFLKMNGYEVIEASNGEEGMQKTFDTMPDLIILDLLMPIMNGFEVIEKLKANVRTAGIPILMLTTQEVEESDGSPFLRKPFSTDLLYTYVEKLLSNA